MEDEVIPLYSEAKLSANAELSREANGYSVGFFTADPLLLEASVGVRAREFDQVHRDRIMKRVRENPYAPATAPMIGVLDKGVALPRIVDQAWIDKYLQSGGKIKILGGTHVLSVYQDLRTEFPERPEFNHKMLRVYKDMPDNLALHIAHEHNHTNDLRKPAEGLADMLYDFRKAWVEAGRQWTAAAKDVLKDRYIRDDDDKDKLKDHFVVTGLPDPVWSLAYELILGGDSYKVEKEKKNGVKVLVQGQPEKSLANLRAINGLPDAEQLRLLQRILNQHLPTSRLKLEATELKSLIEVKEAHEHAFKLGWADIVKQFPSITTTAELAKWVQTFATFKHENKVKGRKKKGDVANIKAIPPTFLQWAASYITAEQLQNPVIKGNHITFNINGRNQAIFHTLVVAVTKNVPTSDAKVAICDLHSLVAADPKWNLKFTSDYFYKLLRATDAAMLDSESSTLIFMLDDILCERLLSTLEGEEFSKFNINRCVGVEKDGRHRKDESFTGAYFSIVILSDSTKGSSQKKVTPSVAWCFDSIRESERLSFLKEKNMCVVNKNEKPTRLYSALLGAFVETGETVLDLFSFTGACQVACVMLGLNCYSFEENPWCYDAIISRVRGLAEKIEDSLDDVEILESSETSPKKLENSKTNLNSLNAQGRKPGKHEVTPSTTPLKSRGNRDENVKRKTNEPLTPNVTNRQQKYSRSIVIDTDDEIPLTQVPVRRRGPACISCDEPIDADTTCFICEEPLHSDCSAVPEEDDIFCSRKCYNAMT
eukprot:TRINITY_DN5231_c0_g3_i1.p1 TRINITY_DN5231_c0_g3~~TRINITY_DN5231_c0_g3_i1.p1  ORF type:complete len:871 (-),score=105.88 TRINITY_DN5231_c0_g3_i1:68-2371(-)